MKIPSAMIRWFHDRFRSDVDTSVVLQMFDEPSGSFILEVGAHDEPIANILADCGFSVMGIDIREYDKSLPRKNYKFLRHDFCDLPEDVYRELLGKVDCVISISAIEHFGLGTYQEGMCHEYYDVIAMRTVWNLLKENGTCYLTVPYGKSYIENDCHWRVYDFESSQSRLIQDFTIEECIAVVSGPSQLDGKPLKMWDVLTAKEANRYCGNPPHVSMVAKLKKVSKNRLAPDGR